MTQKQLAAVAPIKEVSALDRIDNIQRAELQRAGLAGIRRTLAIADAHEELRQLLTDDLLKNVMNLQGRKLGFLTDRDDKGGYDIDTVRDVMIEAVIAGFSMDGNEINIIAGNLYVTRQGLERKLKEYPGLSDLKLREGVPHTRQDGALVEYHATWLLGNIPDEIHCVDAEGSDTRICVRVNKGMGIDAILGKAKRKMLSRVYARITGSQQYDEPDEETPQSDSAVDESSSQRES